MLQLMVDATGDEQEKEEANDANEGSEEFKATKHRTVTSAVPASCEKNSVGKLTNEQIVAEAVGLMMAGYDTTANTLAYVSYLLALHPEIQEKLQSEIDSYFSDKPVCLHVASYSAN